LIVHPRRRCDRLFVARRWFTVKQHHHRYLTAPQALLPWLLAQGSLTVQLRAYAGGQFWVQPLGQAYQRPLPDEARCLGIAPSAHVLVREVYLYGADAAPWVHARSVFPLPTIRGSGRRLLMLKSRSLGTLLFERGGVQRVPQVQQRKARQLAHVAEGWTRRTTYRWHDHPVLVQETFLPAFEAALAAHTTLK